MFFNKITSCFNDIKQDPVKYVSLPFKWIIDTGKELWEKTKVLFNDIKQDPVKYVFLPFKWIIDAGKELWGKTQFFKTCFAPSAHVIAFCLLCINLYVFYDEVDMMLKWVFDMGGKIVLLSTTALVGVIIFFIWMAYAPVFPIFLSVIALIILTIPLVIVIFELPLHQEICHLLDTDSRNEAIKFIAIGMGGVVAAILAASGNRRSAAQEDNNELIRKGNDDVRFQGIVRDLGHDRTTVRITAFYRFLYLAEKKQDADEKTKKLRQDIFEILCGCLRGMSRGTSSALRDEHKYQIERQALFDVLFKGKFRGDWEDKENFVPSKFLTDLHMVYLAELDLSGANLLGVILSGANLSNANLSHTLFSDTNLSYANLSGANLSYTFFLNANLLGANLSSANLSYTNLPYSDLREAQLKDAKLQHACNIKGADFRNAKIGNRAITEDDVPKDQGKYYANWNLSPEKEKNKDRSPLFIEWYHGN